MSTYNIYSKTGINPKAIDTDFINCFAKADELANIDILSDTPDEQKISVVLQNFVELGSAIDQLKENEAAINNIKLTQEQIKQISAAFPTDQDKFKQNCTKFNAIIGSIGALIGSTVTNVKNVIAKLVGIIKKSEDISNANNGEPNDQGVQGDTNDQNPTGDTENVGDNESSDTPESTENQSDVADVGDGSGSDETNADETSTETFDQTSLTKGQKLTTDEAEKILKQLGVIGDDKHLNEKITYQPLSSTNKKVFTDSNNQQYKGLKKVRTDDNTIAWVVEYSDEEISEDEDVVTESHSPYYW